MTWTIGLAITSVTSGRLNKFFLIFCPTGEVHPEGGRISITANKTKYGVEISVTDTGIGIRRAEQPTIFEEFRQMGGDCAHKKEGTGLGLTLAKKFVELHGGKFGLKAKSAEFQLSLHSAGQGNVSLIRPELLFSRIA